MEKGTVKSVVSRILAGALIGLAAIAPGVSGGSIAIIFGLYQPITEALADIRHDFLKKLRFFWPLVLGAAVGMLLFGQLVGLLFAANYNFACALFVGLMLGTVPSVFRESAKEGFRVRYLFASLLFAALIVWLTALEEIQYTGTTQQLSYPHMLLCGGILGLGSVLPGTSASFVLIALGLYEPMLKAVNQPDVLRLAVLGVGFCAAVLIFAKFVTFLYKKAYGWVSFATFGMIVGSILNILPPFSWDVRSGVNLLVIVGAAAVSYFLLKLKK